MLSKGGVSNKAGETTAIRKKICSVFASPQTEMTELALDPIAAVPCPQAKSPFQILHGRWHRNVSLHKIQRS